MRKYRGGIKEFFVVTSKEKAEKNWKKKVIEKEVKTYKERERERERETKIKKQTKAFYAQISHCRWWFMTLPA